VAKFNSTIDMAVLENALRDDLNKRAPRALAVLRPLKVIIENYPEDRVEEMEAVNNPEDPAMGTRRVPFSRELYIEHDDFREDPPPKFFRLAPGREVRLRAAYIIRCTDVVKDARGNVVAVRCTYDPESRSGTTAANRKVKGTLHWVSAPHAVQAEVRLFDHLFQTMDPEDVPAGTDWHANLNPNSLEVLASCQLEPGLAAARPGDHFQFERLGYFTVDRVDSRPGVPVFNRSVPLRDTWARIAKSQSNG
jgi:glutaminyl-tRNA synthetase